MSEDYTTVYTELNLKDLERRVGGLIQCSVVEPVQWDRKRKKDGDDAKNIALYFIKHFRVKNIAQ